MGRPAKQFMRKDKKGKFWKPFDKKSQRDDKKHSYAGKKGFVGKNKKDKLPLNSKNIKNQKENYPKWMTKKRKR